MWAFVFASNKYEIVSYAISLFLLIVLFLSKKTELKNLSQ